MKEEYGHTFVVDDNAASRLSTIEKIIILKAVTIAV